MRIFLYVLGIATVQRCFCSVPADTHQAGLGSERDIIQCPQPCDPDARESVLGHFVFWWN